MKTPIIHLWKYCSWQEIMSSKYLILYHSLMNVFASCELDHVSKNFTIWVPTSLTSTNVLVSVAKRLLQYTTLSCHTKLLYASISKANSKLIIWMARFLFHVQLLSHHDDGLSIAFWRQLYNFVQKILHWSPYAKKLQIMQVPSKGK